MDFKGANDGKYAAEGGRIMKKYGDTIGEGKACVVVREKGLEQTDHEFWKWLEDEGFVMWQNHGHYKGINWVFINLNSMVYAPGMPGVKIVMPIRDIPGISIEEFKTIWNIFRYREDHPVKDDSGNEQSDNGEFRISPAVPPAAHICHIYEIEDAKEAGKDFETEFVKSYGSSTEYQGVVIHSNHECEEGGRSLVRCKKCGALLLSQHSSFEAMDSDYDGSFRDWLPVWSEEEAELLNIFLDAGEFANCSFRHLRSNNYRYYWVGEDQPRPMDLPELRIAIEMKYGKPLKDNQNE